MGAAFHSHANRCRSCSGNLLLMATFARTVVQPPEEFQARREVPASRAQLTGSFSGLTTKKMRATLLFSSSAKLITLSRSLPAKTSTPGWYLMEPYWLAQESPHQSQFDR
jgi:hypothetical protein